MFDIQQLEQIAANAWRPAIEQHLDGWRLRYDGNITQRANSVLPLQHYGDLSLEHKIAQVEEFYARWNCPSRFQITDAVVPGELASELKARGYQGTLPTEVQTARISAVQQGIEPVAWDKLELHPSFLEEWLEFYVGTSGKGTHEKQVRRGILQRIGPERVFILLKEDEVTAGCGLGVFERGWVGIFSMLTHPDFRRRGVAKRILRAISDWGRSKGAAQMYLQVEGDNEPALSLYKKVGFKKHHAYYYFAKSNF